MVPAEIRPAIAAADQRRLHIRLLFDGVTLVPGEALELATAASDTRGSFRRHAFSSLVDLGTAADAAVADGLECWIGQRLIRCPHGGMAGSCGCAKAMDVQHTAAMMSVFADVDVKPGRYATLDIARDAIAAVGPVPSFVVLSGGGLQPIWSLNTPCSDIDRVCAILRAIRNRFQTDATVDGARVMRLAGTVNRKAEYGPAGRPTGLLGVTSRRFAIEELERAFPTNTAPPTSRARAPIAVDLVHVGPVPAAKLAWLLRAPGVRGLWDRTRRLPSASEYDFGLACAAAQAGWSDNELAALIIHNRLQHGDSQKDAGYPGRTITNVRTRQSGRNPRRAVTVHLFG